MNRAVLASDPRFRPLGPELYADAPPTHHMSHVRIDPALTFFDEDPKMMDIVQELWKRLAYDNKKMAGVFPDDPDVLGPYYGVREVPTNPATSHACNPAPCCEKMCSPSACLLLCSCDAA